VRNSDFEYGLSLLTLGLEKERSTLSSSSFDSSVSARNRYAVAYGIDVFDMQIQWMLVALMEIGDFPAPQLVWDVSSEARHFSR
jgi:hypothetical protein